MFPILTDAFSDHAFPNNTVSRNHMEFYAISFDESLKPMVYVRDRQSANGTFVNGKLIGRGPHVTPGRVLEHGDVVTIGPTKAGARWTCKVKLPFMQSEHLTEVQTLEAQVSCPHQPGYFTPYRAVY